MAGYNPSLEENRAYSILFETYAITQADDYMLQFVEAIRNCTNEIVEANELLSAKKLFPIRQHLIKNKDFESNYD